MAKSTATAWFAVAKEAEGSARACQREGFFRSVMNRAYFAMYAATTGALIHGGQRPRDVEGTWTHQDLPEAALAGLRKALGRSGGRRLRNTLKAARYARQMADYSPTWNVTEREARKQLREAGMILDFLADGK